VLMIVDVCVYHCMYIYIICMLMYISKDYSNYICILRAE
jgi:hypothetical protein